MVFNLSKVWKFFIKCSSIIWLIFLLLEYVILFANNYLENINNTFYFVQKEFSTLEKDKEYNNYKEIKKYLLENKVFLEKVGKEDNEGNISDILSKTKDEVYSPYSLFSNYKIKRSQFFYTLFKNIGIENYASEFYVQKLVEEGMVTAFTYNKINEKNNMLINPKINIGTELIFERNILNFNINKLDDYHQLNNKERFDFVYNHEFAHSFMYQYETASNISIKDSSNFYIESYLINHTKNKLNESTEKVLQKNYAETYADAFSFLLLLKKNPEKLNDYLEHIYLFRLNAELEHFSLPGLTHIKETLKDFKEKGISIEKMNFEQINRFSIIIAEKNLNYLIDKTMFYSTNYGYSFNENKSFLNQLVNNNTNNTDKEIELIKEKNFFLRNEEIKENNS